MAKELGTKLKRHASGGVSTDDCVEYDIVSPVALKAYVDRLVYGGKKRRDKGFESFDARCPVAQQQAFAEDDQLVIDRLNHVIHHTINAIAVVRGHKSMRTSPGGDAGAIMFGGGVLAEWEARRRDKA